MDDASISTTESETGGQGLTKEEVASRVAAGKSNRPCDPPTRSFLQILSANALTPVNAIMLALFVLVVISGHIADGLFVGVVISNTVLGVVQEVKARRELARLEVLTESKAMVIREGQRHTIDAHGVVIDDLVVLTPGAQAPVDGVVESATGLQLDESLLTGESEPVAKTPGDEILSGSFVIAGFGTAQASAVGDDSFASTLTNEAKTFNSAESQLRKAVDYILSRLTIIIPIASILLLLSLLDTEDRWQDALQGTVAAAVAMVPDGLVLLTSLAFIAGVLEISRRNALAKQLSTVEVLARVDVLCLDKTGTITTGNISFSELHPLGNHSKSDVTAALQALASADEAPNLTMAAIGAAVGTESDWKPITVEPFSSARKWSATEFEGHGWVYLGAPDILLEGDAASGEVIDRLSAAGQRLIAVGASPDAPTGDVAPSNIDPMVIVELRDEIRSDAAEILAYFADQDVSIKVISGDNPETVAVIGARAGLDVMGSPVDARELVDNPEALGNALEEHDVFGRVAPRQKQAMVHAMQANGHTVAMTGDGVNDVLALKDADLGIAMGSGSAATRSVADLVLTDDAFSTLPVVVNEGRKVINNVERVANLFVTKAVYAVLLTIAIGLIRSPFPFLPRQLTLIGTFSIGVPGFFLALSPEVTRVRSGFLDRVLRFSIPAGVIAGVATFAAYEIVRRNFDLALSEERTLATITLLGVGLAILLSASRPLQQWKVLLAVVMAVLYALILAFPWTREFFELDLTSGMPLVVVAIAVGVGGALIFALRSVVPGLRVADMGD